MYNFCKIISFFQLLIIISCAKKDKNQENSSKPMMSRKRESLEYIENPVHNINASKNESLLVLFSAPYLDLYSMPNVTLLDLSG